MGEIYDTWRQIGFDAVKWEGVNVTATPSPTSSATTAKFDNTEIAVYNITSVR